MTSDALPLRMRSDPDVQIAIYDSAGIEHSANTDLPRGLYRVRLECCGFIREEVILHDSSEERSFAGPAVESPAPIEISSAPSEHAQAAQQLGTLDERSCRQVGHGVRDARLLVFVRRMRRAHSETFLGEPMSIHDMTGRLLCDLTPGTVERAAALRTGYLAIPCSVPAGSYRLRVGRTRRDLAITVPAGRAAHVFLGDHGAISLRTARVYLMQLGNAFDPRDPIARAMENVLWALSQPSAALPRIARDLIQYSDRDPVFGIACAHLARRQGDHGAFAQILRALGNHVFELPDVTILHDAAAPEARSQPGALATPPLFRASFVLALEDGVKVAARSAFAEAAKTAHGDSMWCTWSPRWWDERWIEPTVERLRSRRDGSFATVDAIARTSRLPPAVVERALERFDAEAASDSVLESRMVPGYEFDDQPRRGARSIVYSARRVDDGTGVALKLFRSARGVMSDEKARAIAADLEELSHPSLVRFRGCRALFDGAIVCIELERGRENLFDHIATRGPIAHDEACNLVLQALEALTYLHRRGITHGNIHPGNLLIRTDGKVVLDLPIQASHTLAHELGATMNIAGDEIGFLAPSVAGGAPPTPVSDTWSMVATLYFLLTQELPRDRYTDQGDLEAARDNPVIPIIARLPDLPLPLAECIERALTFQGDGPACDSTALGAALRCAAPASQAVRLYDELVGEDPVYESTLRNVFLRLTALTGSQPRIAQDDVQYGDTAEDRRVQHALQRFQAAGLLAIETDDDGGEPREYIRLVHENVLRGWTRLRHWHQDLDSVPETRSLLISLGYAARRWRLRQRASLLWSDRRVALAREIREERRFAYNAIESEFLRRSERWRATQRYRLVGAVAAFAVVSGGGVWQHEVASDTVSARNGLQQTLARSLQEIGRQHVLGGRPLQALPYLAEAGIVATPSPALQMLFHKASRGLPIAPALEHKDEVMRASFSPDGTQVVTASADGAVYVWNTVTGKRVTSLVAEQDRAHNAATTASTFSPDGKWIITASQDWTARIWDARTGKPVSQPLKHRGIVLSAMFSRDGRHALTASLDHTVRIWSTKTGDVEHKLDCGDAALMASFSTEGAHVVAACGDGVARIWNTKTGAVEHELRHRSKVWSAAFSADDTRVVTAGQDRLARIWDARTGEPAVTENTGTGTPIPLVLEHRDDVTGASFDATGQYVVTTSDYTARVWDAATGAPITPWLEHRGRVNDATFIPSGSRLVTASSDGTARIWDTATGRLLLPLLEHTASVSCAMFSADGTRVITTSVDRTARIWDVTGGSSPVMLAFDGLVYGAAFSPDGHRMATASADNMARIWDVTTGRLLVALPHPAEVKVVVFHRDGVRVATISDDRRARILDTTTGQVLVTFALPAGTASATFSPDGSWLVTSGGGDGTHWESSLRIWNIHTSIPVPLALANSDNIASAAVSRDRSRLVALNRDRTVRVWDVVTGMAVMRLRGNPGGVTSVAFSPDSRRIITSGEDRTVRIWNAVTGEAVAPVLEHDDRVVSASFSPDGTRAVTISGDRTAQVWDTVTGRPITPPLRTDDSIVSAGFTADGSRLIVADRHTVRSVDVSLDTGSPKEWSAVAQRSPYLFRDGVLVRRVPAPGDHSDELYAPPREIPGILETVMARPVLGLPARGLNELRDPLLKW